ncbi:hypothetical protein WS68_11525 [Burkholderia sp. TSV86]|nr:hypothetical protein WS68_11525 [Burkholderia sp. TSV86]
MADCLALARSGNDEHASRPCVRNPTTRAAHRPRRFCRDERRHPVCAQKRALSNTNAVCSPSPAAAQFGGRLRAGASGSSIGCAGIGAWLARRAGNRAASIWLIRLRATALACAPGR